MSLCLCILLMRRRLLVCRDIESRMKTELMVGVLRCYDLDGILQTRGQRRSDVVYTKLFQVLFWPTDASFDLTVPGMLPMTSKV